MKKCIKCDIEKSESEFYKWKGSLRGSCKQCCAKSAKERGKAHAQSVGHNKKNLSMPSQEQLKELFDYHADGYFIRRISRGTQRAGSKVEGKLEAHGYRRMNINYNLYLTHRLIWMWHYGTEPKFIDHINHNRVDNRIENLEIKESDYVGM